LFSRLAVVAAATGTAAIRINSHDVINSVSSIFDSSSVFPDGSA